MSEPGDSAMIFIFIWIAISHGILVYMISCIDKLEKKVEKLEGLKNEK